MNKTVGIFIPDKAHKQNLPPYQWFDRITNKDLWSITQQEAIENQIKIRKWNCIGHTLRKEAGAIEKTSLDWNPQGYRRRSRPMRI
jgi:hypothetical protein